MNRTVIALVVPLLACMVGLPSAASAATVKVRSLSAPRSTTAGFEIPVDVGLKRTGRTPAATVQFYLSANARRDSGDARLSGAARVRAARRSGATRVSARVRVPGAQASGDYSLIACVGSACRARRLRVTDSPVGTRELVEAAVAAGKITPEQGLVYRVFSAFGDRRLPAAYAGDAAAPEHTVMREVVDRWQSLSSAQRAQLGPFFVPPAGKRSWYLLARRASRRARHGISERPDVRQQPARQPELALDRAAERARTGVVAEGRRRAGENNTSIGFALVAGTVTWSFSGTNQGCTYSAGPVTLQIKPDGSQGYLSLQTWGGQSPMRRYIAFGQNLPLVPGTVTCENGPHATSFRPHNFLGSYMQQPGFDIPPDGILQGNWTGDEGSGGFRDVTYDWRLEPSP